MNISLNLTLFIQILNFLLAYYFISKFFLKPALSIFKKDKDYSDNLKNQLSLKKDKILNIENYKELKYQEFQNYYKKIIPNQELKIDKIKFDNLNLKLPEKIDSKEIDKIIKDAANYLKLKVIND